MREEIRCSSGKLLAEIDVEARKLYLWCKYHKDSHPIDLQPFIDRMLSEEARNLTEHDGNVIHLISRVS